MTDNIIAIFIIYIIYGKQVLVFKSPILLSSQLISEHVWE